MEFELPAGWGEARLDPGGTVAHGDRRTARSYDHLGTALLWSPGDACAGAARIACDLEHEARFAAPVRVLGAGGAAVRIESWLVTEVVAKLIGRPVLALLQTHGVISVAAQFPASLDLNRFAAPGKARIFLARSADGSRAATFGMLEENTAPAEA